LKIGIDFQFAQSESASRGIGYYGLKFIENVITELRENDNLVLFIDSTSKINEGMKKKLDDVNKEILYAKIPKMYQNEFTSDRLSKYMSMKSALIYSDFVRDSVDTFVNLSTYESVNLKFTTYLPSTDHKFEDYAVVYDFIRNLFPIMNANYAMRKNLIDNSLKEYRKILFISDAVYDQGITEFGFENKSRVLSCDFLE
jgi:hypothetical protein